MVCLFFFLHIFLCLSVIRLELLIHWSYDVPLCTSITGMILVRTLHDPKHGATESAVGTVLPSNHRCSFHSSSVHAVMSNIDLPCDPNRLEGCAADPRFLGSWAPK